VKQTSARGGENFDRTFQHTPLDLQFASVRIVPILDSGSDGSIRCRTRHVRPLTDRPSSSATVACSKPNEVSLDYSYQFYLSGQFEDMQWFMMNGSPLRVCKNFYDFLQVASHTKHVSRNNTIDHEDKVHVYSWPSSIWIDAMCISQNNTTEKNHQVQQMGRIYSDAKTRCCVDR
jgi:hypothetical protein